MSSRNRNSRGPNRNSGSTQGEEAHLWSQIKDDIRSMVEGVNNSNDSLRGIMAQDNFIAKNKEDVDMAAEEQKLDNLLRGGVKGADMSKQQIEALIEHVTVLRALVKAREDAEAQAASASGLSGRERPIGLLSSSVRSSSARGSSREREREREKERERERDPVSVYDFDGAGDSPMPSPIGSHTRKLGGSAGAGSDRSGNRDSLPPRGGDRDTPGKSDSVPPESAGGPGSATASQRARVTFYKGQDVVFKPKPTTNTESTEWMMGRVQQVLEGKSRRYKVQDADPDLPPDQRVEYKTVASSMIPIPPAGAELAELDQGRMVLALYPDSTTFYKAEVMGMDPATRRVSLRFEGEENSGTLQLVDRRYVVEYRN
ncbi:SGF29 tudor-like domain-containing protein [Lasiosphaeria miniovina]|uniref:SGF29 tudor-like domain-containing protein n=1 Tax=Lasiosphaeria miniovina TaxID=1954250 RepID=A0AA40DXM0_9PEZI|nr:SGF29 tudor-like domain-containing protein [Lasiosphaeria miniovina]KAK0717412.1 SGF29 tudor-like domain-containing protein [Lasiosphaeria miniovina]